MRTYNFGTVVIGLFIGTVLYTTFKDQALLLFGTVMLVVGGGIWLAFRMARPVSRDELEKANPDEVDPNAVASLLQPPTWCKATPVSVQGFPNLEIFNVDPVPGRGYIAESYGPGKVLVTGNPSTFGVFHATDRLELERVHRAAFLTQTLHLGEKGLAPSYVTAPFEVQDREMMLELVAVGYDAAGNFLTRAFSSAATPQSSRGSLRTSQFSLPSNTILKISFVIRGAGTIIVDDFIIEE